jgi:hypothetical protein
MADNVTITPGTGATVAADECPAASGILVQRTKTTWGPDGTANDVDVATGKPMPVQLRGSDGTDRSNALPVTATLAAETTKVIGTVNVTAAQAPSNGQATKANSTPVVPASDWVYNTGKYVAVAASQTDSVIQASAGATGDYLDHVVVVPATTAAGVVTIKDNATAIISYPGGGTTALLTLTPFTIYVGAVSSSGAWKVTTGANVSVLAVGRFS